MKNRYSSFKRITSLLLSFLLVGTLFPLGMVTEAEQSGEVLSFEQSNPVAVISCKAGETVDTSALPGSLTAVTAFSSETFEQRIPSETGKYTPPEDAGAKYDSGETVVYTFTGASGTEHRMYGAADGIEGWFACTEDGNIYGMVQSVRLEWDASQLDTSAPGTAYISANVLEYAVAAPTPEAQIQIVENTENAQLDDNTSLEDEEEAEPGENLPSPNESAGQNNANDAKQILSFEAGNPAASITCQTGDTVDSSRFPAALTAIVAESAGDFAQAKPESSGNYTAPENADADYEAGNTVIYTYSGPSGTEYRVYGTANGTQGWFACDAAGTISGRVQSVSVNWDTSNLNTAAAGTYTVKGSVAGYTLACSEPEASVTVNAKSGDENIALHTLTWISGTPDGNSLSLSPETNIQTRAACQIDFSKGGDEDIPAGQIEIRLPAHIFYGRDGKSVDTVNIPLAKAPEETGNTGFHYFIDPETDEIVIRNYKTISASYHFICQIGYDFIPYYVADGYNKNDIQATFQVRSSQGEIKENSDVLSVKVHTETKEPTIYKSFSNKYETWKSEWGTEPGNSADYFYVEWSIYASRYRGTQPYTLTFQENVGSDAELIGWKNGSQNYTLGSREEYEKTVFYNSASNSNSPKDDSGFTHYVLVKYPRTTLEKTTKLENSCTACVNGLDGDNRQKTDSGSYTYVAPNLEYKGDLSRIDKSGNNHMTGGINMLESGKSAGTYYSISTTTRGYGLTNGGVDSYTTVLEDDILAIRGEKLDPQDYSFTEFYLTGFTEYGFKIDPEKGYQEVANGDYASYQPISVQVKTAAAPEQWTSLGQVKKQADGSYRWVDLNGNKLALTSSTGVQLPEETYDIRFEHTGTVYQVSFSVYLSYKLHPTEHVMGLIKGQDYFQLYNVGSAYAKDQNGKIRTTSSGGAGDSQLSAIANESDMERYGQKVSHSSGANDYSRLRPSSAYTKSSGTPVSDTPNSQETVEYTLQYYEQVNYSYAMTKQEVVDLGIITEQRDAIFYDLLPAGTTLDLGKISAVTYSSSIYYEQKCSYTVESIQNWKNSGRTMVKIHVKAPEGTENYDGYNNRTRLCSGFTVKIKLLNSWDNINDYGKTVLNSSAYYSLDGELVNGFADTGGSITDSQFFVDLDGDGNPPDAQKNVKYAQCTTTFNPLTAAELGFKKTVKAADEEKFGSASIVSAAGTYTYQLRFATSKNINTSNAVIFDILESAYGSNRHWRGTLKSINTSQPESKGIAPVIYYSTYSGFTNLTNNQEQTDLTNSAIWSTMPPADLAEVTAIAIDLRWKNDGTAYTFAPEEVAMCYVTMTAPGNYQDYVDDPTTEDDETAYAYNSAYLQCTTTPVNGGTGKTSTEECEPVTVALRSPEVEIHKASDPQSGTQKNPALVQVGDTITYTLSIANTGTAEAIYAITVEDIIPDGLNIQQADIRYAFGSARATPDLLERTTRISLGRDGQKLVFTIDKLDAGETLKLLIPVIAEEGGAVYENTAGLTGFNGKTWDIKSETTWHKTEGGYELPNTGGFGIVPLYFGGATLSAIGVLGRKKHKAKKQNPDN